METIYFTIIPNLACTAVYLKKDIDGWNLPSFSIEDQSFWQATGQINQALRDRYKIDATTLNCVKIVGDEENGQSRIYYAMENHTLATIPAFGYFWVLIVDVETHLEGEQRDVFQSWYRFVQESPSPENRAPWYMPGWTAQAREWVDAQLIPLGFKRTAPMEQLRSWQRASLWHVPTDEGSLYFKAVPPMFHFEPELTQKLADWFPGRIPSVLASERSHNWFLMDNVGTEGLNTTEKMDHWETAIRSYAEVQVELTNQINELLAIDVPDRQLHYVPRWIDRLFADTKALKNGPTGLTDDEIRQLQTLKPELISACKKLDSYDIPSSLEHGDFWSGQVLLNQNQYAIIDWSDTSISHPFFSAWFFMAELALELPNIPDAYDRLTHAYLEPWSTFTPTRQLLEAFELAQFLGPVHHALIYHRYILPNMEFQWEMERMLPNALRQLLSERP